MSALVFEQVGLVGEGRRVLDAVGFDLPEGGRLAIVGANGAGKSVLARLAAGLLAPTSGLISVLGEGWTGPARAVEALRRRVGVGLAQGALMSDLTAAENVRFSLGRLPRSAERRGRVRVERALADFGVEYAGARRVGDLSLGERRRVDLARVFVTDPDLLILDDLLVGVDAGGAADLERRIDALIGRRRRALLLLTGDAAHAARLSPTVMRLEQGRLTPIPAPQQAPA